MKRFIILCLGLFLSLLGAQAAEQTEMRIGAKVVAVTTPQGMVAIDRSKDLMPDYVKAYFKDNLRGTQMISFSPASEPDAAPTFTILITDGKFTAEDIPERIKMTLDFIADKKRLTEKTLSANKALSATGQVEVVAAGLWCRLWRPRGCTPRRLAWVADLTGSGAASWWDGVGPGGAWDADVRRASWS
jgi:hypothetical protein